MTIDGFLTFVGLILALLALASDATRRRLLLHKRSILFGSLLVLPLVIHLQLFEVTGRSCVAGPLCDGLVLGGGGGRLSPDDAAYLVILAWLAFVAWRVWPRRLRPRHLPQLAGLLTALAEEKRFGELCRIAAPELGMVEKVSEGKDGMASPDHQAAAKAIQRLMHQRPDLVRFIALERPQLAVDMMARRHTLMFDFADDVLETLISTPGSPLYVEVAGNQNTSGPGYHFPDHNTYLHFLFDNAEHARDIGAWEPVMEAVVETLRQARATGYAAQLNAPLGRFSDVGRWKDQTFVGIRFLDMMVSAALMQRIEDHMWLFYTPHVLAPLLDLYDETQPGVDGFAETPTRAAYLIQQLFSMQLRWIASVNGLPGGSPHLVLASPRPTSEPGNIPKSAILAMTDCFEALLTSQQVPERFRHIIADMVFRTLRELPKDGPKAGFRAALIAALVEPDDHKEPYFVALLQALDDFDPGLQDRVEDLRAALKIVLPTWPI